MIAFIVICEVLTFLVLILVLRPMWRDTSRFSTTSMGSARSDETARIEVYRDRRAEIDEEKAAGRLSAEEAAKQHDELVQDVSREFGDTEVFRRSSATRKGALALGLLATTLAATVYVFTGAPQLIDTDSAQSVLEQAQSQAQNPAKLIADLEAKTKANPADAQSWAILGAAYKFTGETQKSVAAFETYFKLEPAKTKESARALAEFAEALAITSDSNFAGRPMALLNQAITLNPDEPKTLAMMGAAQYRAGNLAEARKHLARLVEQMPSDSPQAQQLKPVLERIDEQLKNPAAASAQTPAPTDPAVTQTDPGKADTSPVLSGKVSLSAKASSGNALQDVKAIFISVRPAASSAPAMPIAALKIDSKFSPGDWPLKFSLTDAQSLRAQNRLSMAESVIIEVHLSRTGLPGKNTGDWFARTGPLKPGARDLDIQVDQQQP